MIAPTLQQLNSAAMQALHFTPDDLMANRQGILTESQRQRFDALIQSGRKPTIFIGAFIALAIGGLAIVMAVTGLNTPRPAGLSYSPQLLAGGVLGAITIYYLFMLIYGLSKGMRYTQGKVKMLTGKVKVRFHSTYRLSRASIIAQAAGAATHGYYTVKVGRAVIYTPVAGMDYAFQNGLQYRVYVLGGRGTYLIVSAEAV